MVKFIHKSSIRIQLILVVSCFAVPIALLAWLFIAQSNKDIQFASVEQSGVVANEAIWPILHDLTLASLSGKPDRMSGNLAELNSRLSAFEQSADVKRAQQTFTASVEGARGGANTDSIAAAVDLMTQVGNASNLILDPDLDSFYTMDVSVVKLPSLLQNAATFLQSYRSASADGLMDEREKIELSLLIGQVKGVVEGLDGSLQQAYSGNPDGLVAPALKPDATRFDEAAKQFLSLSNTAITAPVSPATRANLEESAKALLAESGKLWAASDSQLARLLAARKGRFIMTLCEALGASGLAIALAGLLSFAVIRSVTGSVKNLVSAINDLSSGAMTTAVPGAEASTELGAVARAIGSLRDSIIQRVNDANELDAKRKEQERQQLERIVLDFRNEIVSVIASVNGSVDEMANTSVRLSHAAELTGREAQAATVATAQASLGIQTIAAATEELGASIEEIAGQAEKAAEVVHQAAAIADSTDQRMRHLSTSASEIGAVTVLISKIAEQTNLLALNATIEAARAGEAGRGFAIVATEVKSLAGQAAQASNEIAQRIAGVQLASADVAESISAITSTINNVKALAAAIASSVTEQNAATQEITQSVCRAAEGSSTAAQGVDGVANSVGETRAAAVQVDNATSHLMSSSQRLAQTIDGFLREIAGEMQDRRGGTRFAAEGPVTLLAGGPPRQGQLLDISEGGARVATPGGLASGQQISLKLPTGKSLDARVAWTTSSEIGLKIEGQQATLADIAAVRLDRKLAS